MRAPLTLSGASEPQSVVYLQRPERLGSAGMVFLEDGEAVEDGEYAKFTYETKSDDSDIGIALRVVRQASQLS